MRRSTIIKVGAATVAAGAGVILALTSVLAHTSQTATVHVPTKSAVASLMNTIEDQQDAAEAAALLAKEQAEAAKAAAKLAREAAAAAEEAAEGTAGEAAEQAAESTQDAAQAACQATDQPEDTTEKAADATEDATEVPCGEGGEHHVGAGDQQGDNAGSDNDHDTSGPGREQGDH